MVTPTSQWLQERIGKNPYVVSSDIAGRLAKCAEAYTTAVPNNERTVFYLWLSLVDACAEHGSLFNRELHPLSLEEWLNVVDEGASLGVRYMLCCIGSSFDTDPPVWEIAEWAQQTHDIMVGIHMSPNEVTDKDLECLKHLDPEKTCFFVPDDKIETLKAVEALGYPVRSDASPKKEKCVCKLNREMLFVDPHGTLYPCGVLYENHDFILGNVFDEPMHHVIEDDERHKQAPKDTPLHAHGCRACPVRVVKAAFEKMSHLQE